MPINASDIAKLRAETGAGMMDCKNALEEAGGDFEKAGELLRKKGITKATKRAGKITAEGTVASYIHAGGKIGVLVEVNCETDFVARTDKFIALGKEIAMQVASMKPGTVDELMAQAYIRDAKLTIKDLVKSTAGIVGENIVIARFTRMAVGETVTPTK